MDADANERIEALETFVRSNSDRLAKVEAANGDMVSQLHNTIAQITNSFSAALSYQANALSIPLLKDVLVPLVMKLFSFFAVLVLGLLGTVIGIKWIAISLLKLPP